MLKTIFSGEIVLRQAEVSLADSVFLLIDQNRNRLEQYMSWTKSIKSASDQVRFYEKAVHDWDNDIAYHYVIEYRGFAVGAISVHSINAARSSCELGFWIDQSFEGKKIISEAIFAIEKGLAESGFKLIKLRINRGNTRSISRAQASGYRLAPEFSGSSLDHYVKYL